MMKKTRMTLLLKNKNTMKMIWLYFIMTSCPGRLTLSGLMQLLLKIDFTEQTGELLLGQF